MARFDPIATNYSSGEFSKLLMGRVDIAKYANGVDTLENFLIMLQGGITRRPGTRYLAETKDSSKASRLMPFQYSADQDYVMEMGDEYLRFYSNAGSLVSLNIGYDSYTKLLLHADGTDGSTNIIDEIGNTVTAAGTAQIDTAQSKFGGASLLLDGNSDYAIIPNSNDWNLSNNIWTIDCWVRFSSVAGNNAIFSKYLTGTGGYFCNWIQATNRLSFNALDGTDKAKFYCSWTPSADTWYHLELVRNGATFYIFIDGDSKSLTTEAAFASFTNFNLPLWVGRYDINYMNGWIDEFRISQGVARHTANFDVPTVAYAPLDATEVTSPYIEDDIFQVMQAHKGDIKYLTHSDYAPRKLSRTSATAFSIDTVDFVRGPFMDTNTSAITLTPSADTGTGRTITASASLFDYDNTLADDAQSQVGSLWRIKSGVVKILTVTSATVATADVQAEPDGSAGNLATGPGATTDWAEGAFSEYRGYPAVCAFHDGRLFYASTTAEPQKIWGSCLYDYDNFDADDASDDDAVTFEIATEERVAIRWMSSGNKALSLGSTGGTFSAYGTSNGPITPTDIQVNRDTNYGCALLPARKISSFLYYTQRNLHKVRELSYYYDYDVTRATDMTMLAEHVLREGSGIVDWDYQQAPTDRLWCVRSDGELAVLTRNPEQDVMGWSRVIAGADSTQNGKFESVCVIPKAEADDQVWVIVNRTIDGTTKRFVEYFTEEQFTDVWDAICLDSSLTLDSPKTITGATSADPVVITAVGHGFSNGDQVRIDGVVGMTELNAGEYLVANKADDTFELTDLDSADIDGTAYEDYISGGEVRKMVTSVSGLTHLEGEVVQVQMDGDVPTSNSFTVTAGAITLPEKAAVVHVGLPYIPYMKTLRVEGGSQIGSAQGKIKRIPNITVRFYKTLACQLGPTASQDRFTFDSLYTGDKDIPVPMGWEVPGQLVVTSDKPLPLTVISLMPRINVSDL